MQQRSRARAFGFLHMRMQTRHLCAFTYSGMYTYRPDTFAHLHIQAHAHTDTTPLHIYIFRHIQTRHLCTFTYTHTYTYRHDTFTHTHTHNIHTRHLRRLFDLIIACTYRSHHQASFHVHTHAQPRACTHRTCTYRTCTYRTCSYRACMLTYTKVSCMRILHTHTHITKVAHVRRKRTSVAQPHFSTLLIQGSYLRRFSTLLI